ncbi:MAG: NAD-dependent epimerase/dehydratase family protein [Bacteroidales bacterium]|nr:NAD-dependent epimerase/dehydratase family protein [Bacteroidales bacterium]
MILVTGGTGLVGSHLLYKLTSEGEKVCALRRTNSKPDLVKKVFSYYTSDFEKLFQSITWIEGDVRDKISLDKAISGVDKIYHAAAVVSFHSDDKKIMKSVNIQGTANVVNVALENNIKKLCYVSSVAALGYKNENGYITEKNYWKAAKFKTAYAKSKFQSELEVWRGIYEGLDAVIVNPSVILGPGNWINGSSSIIHRVYKGLKFYTSGSTGYVDVRDVVNCMVQLMESDISGERFLLNGGNLSYKEVFGTISTCLFKKPPRYNARPVWLEIAWRLAKVWQMVSGQKPVITRDLAKAAFKTNYYSNDKVKEALHYEFIPINQSLEDNCKLYLKDLEVKIQN